MYVNGYNKTHVLVGEEGQQGWRFRLRHCEYQRRFVRWHEAIPNCCTKFHKMRLPCLSARQASPFPHASTGARNDGFPVLSLRVLSFVGFVRRKAGRSPTNMMHMITGYKMKLISVN